MNSKIFWKGLIGLSIIITVLIFFFLTFTKSHWWRMLGDATIIYGEQKIANPKVYSSPNKNALLIDLSEQGDILYIIDTQKVEIGAPNASNFYRLPSWVYSKEVTPLVAPMTKMEINPYLNVQQRSIEFVSYKNVKTKIVW